VAAVSTGGLFYYFKTGSTPSVGSQLSSGLVQTSNVTSQSAQVTQPVSIFGSPSYGLQVTKVTVAQASRANGYILNVDASFAGSGTWRVNPSNFEVVSGSSAVYTASGYIMGMVTPLSAVVLASGQHAVGQLAFQLPAGQTPAQLEYLNQTANINVHSGSIPQASTYVCQSFDPQVSVSASSISGSHASLQFGSYQGNSGYYLSGDQITFSLVATFSAEYAQNQPTVGVTAITTNDSATAVSQVRPALPVRLAAGGVLQIASFNVTLSTPSSGCAKNLSLQVKVQTVTVTSGTAQVTVTGTALLAANFLSGGTTKTFTCATTSAGSYLTLTNTGSGSASVTTISFTWAGGNTAYTGPTNCSIAASGSSTATTYVVFPATSTISPSAISGQTFTGTVTLSNGTQLLFTGTWQ
jgi:hypothetical protein